MLLKLFRRVFGPTDAIQVKDEFASAISGFTASLDKMRNLVNKSVEREGEILTEIDAKQREFDSIAEARQEVSAMVKNFEQLLNVRPAKKEKAAEA